MEDVNSTISIILITLNVNGFNKPIKRQRLLDCIKNDLTLCCLQVYTSLDSDIQIDWK